MYPLLTSLTVEPAGKVPVARAADAVVEEETVTPLLIVRV
jgi:hypothetical protein